MLKLIMGRAKSGKTASVMETIRARANRGETGAVLLVPEQYSHEAERELLRVCGDRLCLFAEVLSFTTLAAQVESECGSRKKLLDQGGRLLTFARALDAIGSRLRVFGSARRQPELQLQLLRAIDECKTSCVSTERLEEAADGTGAESVRDKLSDLALLLGAYDALVARSGLDPSSRLDLLAQQLPSSRYASFSYYIDGFTDFSEQENRILEILLRSGADLTVCLSAESFSEALPAFEPSRRAALRLRRIAEGIGCTVQVELRSEPPTDDPLNVLERELFRFGSARYDAQGRISLYALPDVAAECEAAAAKCLALVRETGCRWRDIAIAARSFEAYRSALESIFPYYGIPLYCARKSELSEKPLISLIFSAYAIVTGGWDYDDVIAYLKTGLSGLDREECDILENYAFLWSLHGSSWTKEEDWTLHPDGFSSEFTDETRLRLREINALRRRAVAPLLALSSGARAETAAQQVLALASFFETLRLPSILSDHAQQLHSRGDVQQAAEYVQLWELVAGALEQASAILGDTPMDQETFGALFCQMLTAYDVGSIPLSLDRVSAGDMDRMRRRSIRHLIVLGCDSAALPRAEGDVGVFSDDDRELLRAAGLELGYTAEDRLNREFSLVYNCLTLPRDTLTLSWCTTSSEGGRAMPSFVLTRIASLFSLPMSVPSLEACRSAADAPAFELAAAAVGGSISPECAAALEYFCAQGRNEELHRLYDAAHLTRGKLSGTAVQALYGIRPQLSASRIDRLAGCRFAYFLQYGLKAKPHQAAEFSPPEMGTFLHFVLEHVAHDITDAGGFAVATPDMVDELCDRYVSQYVHETLNDFCERPARFIYLFRRLTRQVREVVGDMVAELAKSDFVPLDFELNFGDRSSFPPIRLGNGDESLELTGVADRVDGYVRNGKLYLRVVDYKTGRKSFSLSDVWYGLGMQMLLYLFALQRTGKDRYQMEIVPAGVLYVPARDVLVSASSALSADEILSEKARARRRSGLLLDEEEILQAMERGTQPQYIPVTLRGGAYSGDSLASAEQFGQLSRHIDETLRALAQELHSGSVAADPWFRSKSDSACRFCDYASACHFNEENDSVRYITRFRAPQVWDLLTTRNDDDERGNRT